MTEGKEKEKEKGSREQSPTTQDFHAECLTCCACRKSLMEESELHLGEKTGVVYCAQHADRAGDGREGREGRDRGRVKGRTVKVCGRLPPPLPGLQLQHRELPGRRDGRDAGRDYELLRSERPAASPSTASFPADDT